MSEIKWIKLSVNMFDDEKIKLIRTLPDGDKIVMIWVQMMCLAGKINDGGSVYMGQNLAYSDEMLATIFDQPLNVVRAALSTLDKFEMIHISNDGMIDIVNWEKHQSTDKMAQIKQQNRDRQQRYYYRNKLRELGFGEDEMPNGLGELKELYEEQPNVRLTLPNGTEVRSKKLEVRSEKEEVSSKKEEKKNDSKLSEKQLEEDFESLWQLYPNKKGKATAKKAYTKAIKDGVTNEEIKDGILAYKKEVQLKGTSPQYIAHGSTWFNQRRWEDEYSTTGRVVSDAFVEDAPTNPDEVEYSDEDRYWYEKYMKEHGEEHADNS